MKSNPLQHKLDLQLFAEDNPTPQEQENVDPEKNYAEAIKELKKNTVSKEAYEKLEAQNKQLLDSIINGGRDTDDNAHEATPSIKDLREDLYGGKKELSNLEYCEKTLQLRKEIMEQGGTDPFVPVGKKIKASSADFITAEKIASELQDCIDAAGGDPIAFNNELRRRGLE